VTYGAAGEAFTPVGSPEDARRLWERYRLPGGYLLAVGNLQPRKNLVRLVEAYARARGGGELHGVPLVLAGKAKWRESELFKLVEQRGLSEDVRFPGYIADEDLPALYREAVALVYPSVYEGFGLPPLEAMASGTAVVGSNTASLPEVVGEAALSIDPLDTEALAQALVDVVVQPALRAALQEAGPRRAGQFTWRRCAEETVEAYRTVLGAHR